MKNDYLFTLLDVTGNLPVISVAIQCWVSIILVKTWSEHVSNVSIGSSSFGGISRVLVDLMFFRICFMCPFFVAMEDVGASFFPLLGWDIWRSGFYWWLGVSFFNRA